MRLLERTMAGADISAAEAPISKLRRVIMKTSFVADWPHPPFGADHLAEVGRLARALARL
jgi:hypothetical protein